MILSKCGLYGPELFDTTDFYGCPYVVACLRGCYTLMVEAISTSETLVGTYMYYVLDPV